MDVLFNTRAVRKRRLTFEVGSKVEGGSLEVALLVELTVHSVEVVDSDVLLGFLVLGGLHGLFRNLSRLACGGFVACETFNGLMAAFRVSILLGLLEFCRLNFLLRLGGSIEDPHVLAVRHFLQWRLALGDFGGVGSGLRSCDEDRLHVVVWFASIHYFVHSPCLSIYFVDCLGGRVVDICGDGGLSNVHALFVDQVDQ